MIDIIQKTLSKKIPKIAPFGSKKLLGQKSEILYTKKDGIGCRFDFYFIKSWVVFSINAYYCYCSIDERKTLNSIVNHGINDVPSPRDYFAIAEYFGLEVDYNTYKHVVINWMQCCKYQFFEKIKEIEKPDIVPDSFSSIRSEIKQLTEMWLEEGEIANAGMLYADLFIISGKTCLVTGNGKSDACKLIADDSGSYDFICYRRGSHGLECCSHNDSSYYVVDYCIHMDSDCFGDIIEVDYYEYVCKASGNMEITGTSIPGFYNLLKNSKCKMILAPYADTLEHKSKLLSDYLSKY